MTTVSRVGRGDQGKRQAMPRVYNAARAKGNCQKETILAGGKGHESREEGPVRMASQVASAGSAANRGTTREEALWYRVQVAAVAKAPDHGGPVGGIEVERL